MPGRPAAQRPSANTDRGRIETAGAVIDFGQFYPGALGGAFDVCDLLVEPRQVIFDAAQLALAGDKRRLALQRAHVQGAAGFDELSLQGDESQVAFRFGSQLQGRVERADDPCVSQQPFGKTVDARGRSHELVGAADDSRAAGESKFVRR